MMEKMMCSRKKKSKEKLKKWMRDALVVDKEPVVGERCVCFVMLVRELKSGKSSKMKEKLVFYRTK